MSDSLMIFLNFVLCAIGGLICICRLKFIGPHTKIAITYHYRMWLTLFAWSALSWTYGEIPSWVHIGLSGGALLQLILGSKPWKYGAPTYTIKP